MSKDTHIHIRVSESDKIVLKSLASEQGMLLSTFLLHAAFNYNNQSDIKDQVVKALREVNTNSF